MEGGPGTSNNNGFRRSRGVNWTEEETEQLLEAWSQREVQNLLENGPHNRQAFERISFNLAQHNMDKTPSQCREKIKKLKSIYRSMTNGQGKVSRQLRGRLMQKLHQVMSGLSANVSSPSKDPDLIPAEQEGLAVNTEERQSSGVMPEDFHNTFHESISSNNDYMMDEEDSTSSSDQSMSSSEAEDAEPGQQMRNTPTKTPRKKSTRKNWRKSAHRNTFYVLIDKLIAAQNAANKRFAALEEKRLMIDKELEEKRIEAEARRQEAQRQHELRLVSTVGQQMSGMLKSFNSSPFAARCEPASEPSDKPHQVNGCDDYSTTAVYSNI